MTGFAAGSVMEAELRRRAEIEREVAVWRKERNAAFLRLDMRWARRNFPECSSDAVRLIALHKARYECVDLPVAARLASKRWLAERGYGGRTGPLLPGEGLPE